MTPMNPAPTEHAQLFRELAGHVDDLGDPGDPLYSDLATRARQAADEIEAEEKYRQGVLPMLVSKTGAPDEPVIEYIECTSISGGADYVDGMPRSLTLHRVKEYDEVVGEVYADYVRVPRPGAPTRPAGSSAGSDWHEKTDRVQLLQELGRFCESSPLEGAIDLAGRAYTAAAEEAEGREVPTVDEIGRLIAASASHRSAARAILARFGGIEGRREPSDEELVELSYEFWSRDNPWHYQDASRNYARAVLSRFGGGAWLLNEAKRAEEGE